MQVGFERVLVGGLFLLPFALHRIRRNGTQFIRSDWLFMAGLGFLTVPVHMFFQQLSILRLDASAAATIYSGNPVFAIIIARLILHEPLKKHQLAAILLEVIGIVFILNPAGLELDPIGFAEIIGATTVIALYNTLCKLRIDRLGGTTMAVFGMLFGSAELFLILMLGRIPAVSTFFGSVGLSAFSNVPLTEGFTLRTTLLLLYVGVICAGIGMLLTTKVTEYTSATEASFVYFFKPIIATAIAAWFLRETISVNRMIGIAFFMAASAFVIVPKLIDMRKAKDTDRTPAEAD